MSANIQYLDWTIFSRKASRKHALQGSEWCNLSFCFLAPWIHYTHTNLLHIEVEQSEVKFCEYKHALALQYYTVFYVCLHHKIHYIWKSCLSSPFASIISDTSWRILIEPGVWGRQYLTDLCTFGILHYSSWVWEEKMCFLIVHDFFYLFIYTLLNDAFSLTHTI
jgi:hypothetical protein